MTLKPIETRYRGYRFRSRLEARWAVVFDALELSWQYEPEGFDFGQGDYYLPDFYLEGIGWLEIKGYPGWYKADPEMTRLIEKLAIQSGESVYLFAGQIPYPREPESEYVECWHPDEDEDRFTGDEWWPEDWSVEQCKEFGMDFPACCYDFGRWWCLCPSCGAVGIEYEGRADRLCDCFDGDRGHNGGALRILEALEAGRSARFEHGESG